MLTLGQLEVIRTAALEMKLDSKDPTMVLVGMNNFLELIDMAKIGVSVMEISEKFAVSAKEHGALRAQEQPD